MIIWKYVFCYTLNCCAMFATSHLKFVTGVYPNDVGVTIPRAGANSLPFNKRAMPSNSPNQLLSEISNLVSEVSKLQTPSVSSYILPFIYHFNSFFQHLVFS